MATETSSLLPEFELPPHQQTTALLSVPLEIRTIIYAYVLPPKKIVHPKVRDLFRSLEYGGDRKVYKRHEKVLALARTCQAFYADFLPIYYATKTLSFASAYDCYRYLYMIGDFRRSLVRKIDVWLIPGIEGSYIYKTREIYEWMVDVLKDCRNLKHLGVGVSAETTNGMKGPVEGLEGLRGMGLSGLEVRVRDVWDWGFHLPGIFEEVRDFEKRLKGRLSWEYLPPVSPQRQKQLLGLEMRLIGYMTEKSSGEDEMEKPEENVNKKKQAHGHKKPAVGKRFSRRQREHKGRTIGR
jgi:hypothetical protein